jgi:hypothetical protein
MSGAEIIDRGFAEKFLRASDAPLDYGVYLLFHDWWAEAPQKAIDAYSRELASIPEAAPLLASRYISEPLSLERLAECAPGTLGHAYRRFILDNKLEQNLGRNYRRFNEELTSSGKLDRLLGRVGGIALLVALAAGGLVLAAVAILFAALDATAKTKTRGGAGGRQPPPNASPEALCPPVRGHCREARQEPVWGLSGGSGCQSCSDKRPRRAVRP